MRGYLQRIVSQAMPQGNTRLVHPLVGSISSAAKRERVSDGPFEETVIASFDERQSSQTKVAPSRMLPTPAGRDAVENLPRHGSQGQAPAEGAAFQPLLGKAEAEASSVRASYTHLHASQERPRKDRQNRRETESSESEPGQGFVFGDDLGSKAGEQPASGSVLQRQTPPGEAMMREARARETRIPNQAEGRRTAQLAQFRGLTERLHGPDEIQINIGRIELTAIPQATPRPAAPPRKSLNLDEYLKRRNGRNG